MPTGSDILDKFRNDTLPKYIKQFQDLSGEYTFLQQEQDAINREFLYERQAGKIGTLSSVPTLQDFAIYSFWISYVVLFYMLGIHNSILPGMSKYIFIAGSVLAYILSYYYTILPSIILFVTFVYFINVSYKTSAFFIGFIALFVTIHMIIGTLM